MITRGDIKNQAMLEPSLHKRGGKRRKKRIQIICSQCRYKQKFDRKKSNNEFCSKCGGSLICKEIH